MGILLNYMNIFVFIGAAIIFIFFVLSLSALIHPKAPNPQKLMPYECGEIPVGFAWFQFNLRFYLIALIFLIFDVEVVFLYPCAVIFRDWLTHGMGVFAFVEIFLFIFILFLGLVYVWSKGDLNWVKTVRRE